MLLFTWDWCNAVSICSNRFDWLNKPSVVSVVRRTDGLKNCIISGTQNNPNGTINNISGTKIILVGLKIILVALKLFSVALKLFLLKKIF